MFTHVRSDATAAMSVTNRSVLSPGVKRAISLTSTMLQLRNNLIFQAYVRIISFLFLRATKPKEAALGITYFFNSAYSRTYGTNTS